MFLMFHLVEWIKMLYITLINKLRGKKMENKSQKNSDEDLLKIDSQAKVTTNYKSMFYQFLARPDSMTQVYNKNAVINIEDIYQLNDKVCEKLSNHQNAGFLIKVNVKYINGKTMEFPNWKAFQDHKWYEGEAIKTIVIIWEFNAVLPGLTPARHTLMVKLSNGLRPEEIINLMFTGQVEDIEEMDNNLFPIIARVDFVNRTLGDELINIVASWVKSLPESAIQKSKFVLFLKKHKAIISTFFNWLTNIVLMCTSVFLLGRYILSMQFTEVSKITNIELVHIIYSIFICIAVWILGRRFIGYITDRFFQMLRMYGVNALFNITKGDKNKQERLKREEKNSKVHIIANLGITIIINIICGLLVNFMS